jgi:hypothetical protein
LDIEVSLAADALDGGLVVGQRTVLSGAVVDRDLLEGVGLRYGFWAVFLQEHLGVGSDGDLAEVVCEADAVLAAGFGVVPFGLVESLEAFRGDGCHVADSRDGGVLGCVVARRYLDRLIDKRRLVGGDAEKGCGRLDGVDVSVQVTGQRPGSCTRNNGAILVLVGVVLGVEKALDHLNGKMDNDPILGRAVAHIVGVDTAFAEPLVHQVVSLGARRNKLVNLIGAQMLTVALVVWVGDYAMSATQRYSNFSCSKHAFTKMAVKLLKSTLLETNLQLDSLATMCPLELGPLPRRKMGLLDNIRASSLDRRSQRITRGDSSQHNSREDLHNEYWS